MESFEFSEEPDYSLKDEEVAKFYGNNCPDWEL
jgi:hypothetical protein